ncbi:MAG: transcriptional regulator [Burkholderiales bacterium]
MSLTDEKQGFSRRLRDSLRRTKVAARGATGIAREFNLRYQGAPVTAQAVRKWLLGESLPSQDKMRTLALWLEISPHWLRFGEAEPRTGRQHLALRQEPAAYQVSPGWLAAKFDALSEPHKKMVMEIVLGLLRLEGKR